MVSAIITTHNRKKLLKRAIESVLSQTYKDMECIVVDDASTDGTGELCKSYPIQYFYIPKELGAKDLTDLIKLKGLEEVKELVKQFMLNFKWNESIYS